MFSGLIEAIGVINQVQAQSEHVVELGVDTGSWQVERPELGESVAVDGVCLTVTQWLEHGFKAQLSAETIACTKPWQLGQRVNLERALRVGDRLGGHWVSGHVDGVAHLVQSQEQGESRLWTVKVPPQWMRFMAAKGSVTLEGVSLTINHIEGNNISLQLVPHTLSHTTLGQYQDGQALNLEVDLLARHVDQLLGRR